MSRRNVQGTIYLIHFSTPYRHAAHYMGKPGSSRYLKAHRLLLEPEFRELARSWAGILAIHRGIWPCVTRLGTPVCGQEACIAPKPCGSGVARPGFPAGVLSPVVCLLDDLPDDRAFRVGVSVPVEPVALGEAPLDRLILGGGLAVGAKEVAEQQGELLGEAARPADVDVGSRVPRWFPEVPLGALGVIGPVDKAEALQRSAERLDRLQPGNGDLDIDHGFGSEPGHGRRADVVDADRYAAKCLAQPAPQFGETDWPGGVVVRDADHPLARNAGTGVFQAGLHGCDCPGRCTMRRLPEVLIVLPALPLDGKGPWGPQVPDHGQRHAPPWLHQSRTRLAITEHSIGLLTPLHGSASDTSAGTSRHLTCSNRRPARTRGATNSRQIQQWTEDLESRLADHQAGRGSRLMAVIKAAGIDWKLTRTWTGDRYRERQLKTRAAQNGTAPNAACTPERTRPCRPRSPARPHRPRRPNSKTHSSAATSAPTRQPGRPIRGGASTRHASRPPPNATRSPPMSSTRRWQTACAAPPNPPRTS